MWDIYNGVSEAIEQHKPQLIRLLEEHIDFDKLIPVLAFYRHMGRKHKYHLESYIRAFVVQKLLGIPRDTLLLSVLRLSAELRDFCGFDKVPDASQLTRFRENYKSYLAEMFEHLVDLTESICREINAKKADYFIYDTTGIELPVAENNPKFFNSKLREAKKLAKSNPNFDPPTRTPASSISTVISAMPPSSASSPTAWGSAAISPFSTMISESVTPKSALPRQTTPIQTRKSAIPYPSSPFSPTSEPPIQPSISRPLSAILPSIPTTSTPCSRTISPLCAPASP